MWLHRFRYAYYLILYNCCGKGTNLGGKIADELDKEPVKYFDLSLNRNSQI